MKYTPEKLRHIENVRRLLAAGEAAMATRGQSRCPKCKRYGSAKAITEGRCLVCRKNRWTRANGHSRKQIADAERHHREYRSRWRPKKANPEKVFTAADVEARNRPRVERIGSIFGALGILAASRFKSARKSGRGE